MPMPQHSTCVWLCCLCGCAAMIRYALHRWQTLSRMLVWIQQLQRPWEKARQESHRSDGIVMHSDAWWCIVPGFKDVEGMIRVIRAPIRAYVVEIAVGIIKVSYYFERQSLTYCRAHARTHEHSIEVPWGLRADSFVWEGQFSLVTRISLTTSVDPALDMSKKTGPSPKAQALFHKKTCQSRRTTRKMRQMRYRQGKQNLYDLSPSSILVWNSLELLASGMFGDVWGCLTMFLAVAG